MFRLGVVASAELADHGVLGPGFDIAKFPPIPVLGRGGQSVGSFNDTVAAIKVKGGRIDHPVSMVRGEVDHDGVSSLAIHVGGGVRVEISDTSNKEVLGIVDGGLDVREEEIVIIREGL